MDTPEKKQILVVEDEGIIAADLQSRLRRLGYAAPAVAGSGREALDLARKQSFDLVLMDIHLKGGMDGIQAAQALRRERDVPVVYVTAYADARTVERAKTTEPFGYLVKPIRDKPLRSAIEISLRRHELERRAAQDLQLVRNRCEALASDLNSAKENECRRLARQLHDDIQQRLTALALEMEIQQDESELPPQARVALRSAGLKLRQLCRDLHRLSHDLHPRVLEELGLAAALLRLSRAYRTQGFHVQFHQRAVPAALPADAAVCLYRVAQESLLNVVKHAGTDQAAIWLEGIGSGIALRISDRGKGFDPERAWQGSPLGLRGMSDRVTSVGGELTVTSTPGEGTEISALVPLGDGRP